MSVELGSAYGKIVLDASGVHGAVNQANSALDRVGKTAAKMGAAVAGAMAVAGAALGAASVKLVNMGADAGETASLLAVSLGPETDALNNRLRNFADVANRSFYELQEGSATFVAMTRAMGATQEVAADLSGDFTEMATDLGSFFNVATEDALHDLRSALAGASEPMQKYGIDVRETTLKQLALERGIISTSSEAIPRLERAMLIADIVTRQAADAMGDAERTSQSFQNQLRGLQGQVKDAAYEIGIKLIPTGERLLAVFRSILPGLKDVAAGIFAIFASMVELGIDFVESLARGLGINFDALAKDGQTWGENFVVSLAEGMAAAISAVINVLNQLGQVIADWLAPGSPPKLLPHLPEWGAAAMSEYMAGWLEGDFSVFDEIASTVEGLIRSMSANIKEKDLIPRILGSRSAIAAAVEQVRETGAVTDEMLSLVLDKAKLAGGQIRDYVTALFDVAEADREVIRAQEELNRITAEYNAILDPFNAQLKDIQDRQQNIRDQQELARIQEELSSGQLTALEKEGLMLRQREIMVRKQIRDKENEKDAAVTAAQATLDAAEQEKKDRELKAEQLKRLLNIQKDQNSLLGDQKELIEGLANALEKAGSAAKGAARKAGKAMADLAGGAAAGTAGVADAITTQFDEVFDRVSEKFAPLQTQVEELGQTWGRVFNNARNRVEDLRRKWDESKLKKKLDDLNLSLEDVFKFGLLAAVGILVLRAAFTVGGWLASVAGLLGTVAGHLGTIGAGILGMGVFAPILFLLAAAILAWTEALRQYGSVGAVWEAAQENAAALASQIEIIFGLLATKVEDFVAKALENALALDDQFRQIISLLVLKVLEKIQELVQGVIQWFKDLWHDLVGGSIVVEIVDRIIDEIDRLVDTVIEAIVQFVANWLVKFGELRDMLAAIWTTIKARVDEIWEAIRAFIQEKIEAVKAKSEEVWEAVRAFIDEKITAIQTRGEEVWEAVRAFIDEKLTAIQTNVETIWEAVRAFIDEKINAIKTAIETAMGGIETAIQPVYDLWTKLVDAVQTFWDWLKDKVFNIHIAWPTPPSWFQWGSPIFKGHKAFLAMAKDMNRIVIKPRMVFPEMSGGIAGLMSQYALSAVSVPSRPVQMNTQDDHSRTVQILGPVYIQADGGEGQSLLDQLLELGA